MTVLQFHMPRALSALGLAGATALACLAVPGQVHSRPLSVVQAPPGHSYAGTIYRDYPTAPPQPVRRYGQNGRYSGRYGGQYGGGYRRQSTSSSAPILSAAEIARRCNVGRLVGGLVGGGVGYAASRQDGRAWAVPLGALLGQQMGCSVGAGGPPLPW